MTAAVAQAGAVDPAALKGTARFAWNWKHNPRLELWLAWGSILFFYNVYTIVFFMMTRSQPPPKAWWDLAKINWWFTENGWGILWGFGIMFVMGALSIGQTALIAYSIRRMSVSPAWTYAYLIIYGLAGVPGMLLTCIALVVGAMRPDRDPQLLGLLYDMGFLSFSGTMGIFLIGSVIWGVAILLDKNSVLPKWLGYFNICNALTEVVVATCVIAKDGPFAWNGTIAFWINMVVFGVYTGAFINMLKAMIERVPEDEVMRLSPR
jgi:hypothetical protein